MGYAPTFMAAKPQEDILVGERQNIKSCSSSSTPPTPFSLHPFVYQKETMVGLPPGRYFIVNDVQTPQGVSLSAQYHGPRVPLTVEKKLVIPAQVWIVKGLAGGPQHISPETDQALQNAPVEDLIAPENDQYTWNISLVQGLCIIQDSDKSQYWTIKTPEAKASIVLTTDPGEPTVYWKFEAAPAKV
ncbi:hypothetical protein OG21DRAFT_1507607 [Imleria badia]|nr:hypothetical protein OG21DRAFT_1507607 [Imleria badia]